MADPQRDVPFTHLDRRGALRMVDVSDKEPTRREAVAGGELSTRPEVLDQLLAGGLAKGDALAAARVAGVLAAKRAVEWIPLCHPLPVEYIEVSFHRPRPETLGITCTVRATARTGVEMEALVGVAAAALTLYDMTKSADREMVIGAIRLERKSGGRSGTFVRPTPGGRGEPPRDPE
jgi:cyclic pyranopterin phosphate synthase